MRQGFLERAAALPAGTGDHPAEMQLGGGVTGERGQAGQQAVADFPIGIVDLDQGLAHVRTGDSDGAILGPSGRPTGVQALPPADEPNLIGLLAAIILFRGGRVDLSGAGALLHLPDTCKVSLT